MTFVSAFSVRYPNAYEYLTQYLNRLTGKRDKIDRLFPNIAEACGVVNRLFAAGSIGGNIATVTTQLSSFRNAMAETGLYVFKGYANILDDQMYGLYKAKSRVSKGRMYEPSVAAQRMLGSKTFATVHDFLAKKLSIPVSFLDRVMVGGAWLSGYYKGKDLGLRGDDLFYYADDVAERTQASANLIDKPPLNAGKIKVTFGQFQTFVYNEYTQIKNDIILKAIKGEKTKQGYGEGLSGIKESRKTGYERLMFYVLGTLAMSSLYDLAGFPNPIRNKEASVPVLKSKIADYVYGHMVNSIPFGGYVRFGGTPLTSTALNIAIYGLGNERDKAKAIRSLKGSLIRIIPGGGQAYKTGQTISTLLKGGYERDKRGNIKFKINTDSFWDVAKGLVFGKWQTKGGQEYIEKMSGGGEKKSSDAINYKSLIKEMSGGGKKTINYKKLIKDMGV
jgi:hypothetical protein